MWTVLLSCAMSLRKTFRFASTVLVATKSSSLCDEDRHRGVGLLTGFDTDPNFHLGRYPHFTQQLNIDQTKTLMKDPYFVSKTISAKCDASVLADCAGRAVTFARDGEFFDRAELSEFMDVIVTGPPGSFACILGGKSTGKSKLVSVTSKRHPNNVIAIDCRSNPNIASGLIAAVAAKDCDAMRSLQKVFRGILQDVAAASGTSHSLAAIDGPNTKSLEDVLDMIIKHVDANVTIIIDEANIALATEGNDETVAATRQALALFTRLTKQERKLNVVLVSSEHTFPYKLNDKRFGFNVLDLGGRVVYAGEVPPEHMAHLLVNKWQVPHSLAIGLITLYGGHINDTIDALLALARGAKKGSGPVTIRLNSQLSSAVLRCLNWKGSGHEDQARMRLVLRELAVAGFSPLADDSDPVAEVLTSTGVAGLVCVESPLIVGLDANVWERHNSVYGLVPSKQSMRLVIAQHL